VLLHVGFFHGGIAVVEETAAIAQAEHARLLWRRLWRGCQEIGDLLDALGEVEL
jgi:succinate dehydrogenase flavin-adding protein (antitoxin of CptAB toxin-antitoxin module)